MIAVPAILIGAFFAAAVWLTVDGWNEIREFARRNARLVRTVDREAVSRRPGYAQRVVDWLALLHMTLRLEGYRRQVDRRIFLAGLSGILTFEKFLVYKEMTVLTVFALLGLVAGDVLGIPLCLMTALGAFFLPDLWLKEKVVKRQRAVLKALPSVIDLLNACVEAGLVFEGAMARVAELEKRSVLGEEFRAALQDIRLGKTRREALLAMADRVDLPELTTVVHAVIQAERMGTSMGPMLRVQADDLRVKRRQRAEKLALEAPVKLLMPLLLCIFPVVFLVIFTPIILQLMESLK